MRATVRGISTAVLIACLGLSTAQGAVTPIDQQQILAHSAGVPPLRGLDAAYKRLAQGYRDLNPKMMADQYAENAFYLAPGQEILRGRKAIEQNFTAMLAQARKEGTSLSIFFRIKSRVATKPIVTDIGTYLLVRKREGKEVGRSVGKFVIAARKGAGGLWRFEIDSWSAIKTD